jgi:hypothetical protein
MTENFKAVEWMRQVRAQIDAEDAGLGWTDKHRKTLEILEKDPLWQKLKGRITDPRTKSLESR